MGKISINTKMKQHGIRLNKEQCDAVKQLNDVSVVTAGGGCGKTNLLIAKINFASLQDPGCSILAITFTKKAVAELQSRLVGNLNCMVNTFHSFFYRILRANGYKSFKFLENDGQKRAIMKKIIEAENLTDKLTVDMLEEALRKGNFADEDTKKAVEAYFDQLKSMRLLCFDSLQYFSKELLQNNPAVAIRTRSLFNYVMVDEAQDISQIQLEIIRLIWPANHINNLTFVGDQKQAIFSFRGSLPNVMNELQQYYEAYTFKLTTNYRSTEAILTCANGVLPSSEALAAVRGKGEPVVFHAADSQKHEAEYVANQIKLLHNGGTPLRDIVVLFRASHAVKELYEVLVREHIPFVQIGSDPFKWNNSRYKCFLAILSFMYDPDNQHYSCALPLFGLPKDITGDIEEGLNLPFSELLMGISSMSKKHRGILEEFFAIDPEKYSLHELVNLIWDKYLKAYFKAEDDEILEAFIDEIADFTSFIQLRNHISEVRRQVKQMQRLVANPNADYLRLMSIHTAKGSECSTVFVVGTAEGILPDLAHDEINIDEENRLAYVAVTRAKDKLFVTYPKTAPNGSAVAPSRFFKQFFDNQQ